MKKVSHRRAKSVGEALVSWSQEEEDDEPAARVGHRHARLTDVLREELDGLVRDELCDPSLDGVNIARVELSIDYRAARVYAQVSDPRRRDDVHAALQRASGYVRKRLTDAVEVKIVPTLRFVVLVAEENDPCV